MFCDLCLHSQAKNLFAKTTQLWHVKERFWQGFRGQNKRKSDGRNRYCHHILQWRYRSLWICTWSIVETSRFVVMPMRALLVWWWELQGSTGFASNIALHGDTFGGVFFRKPVFPFVWGSFHLGKLSREKQNSLFYKLFSYSPEYKYGPEVIKSF